MSDSESVDRSEQVGDAPPSDKEVTQESDLPTDKLEQDKPDTPQERPDIPQEIPDIPQERPDTPQERPNTPQESDIIEPLQDFVSPTTPVTPIEHSNEEIRLLPSKPAHLMTPESPSAVEVPPEIGTETNREPTLIQGSYMFD